MAKLWTANKTWVSDSPNANTEYLVGAANGGCNYQSIPQGGTKRILVSNGANGNVAYGNRSVPLPEGHGNVDIPDISFNYWYINYESDQYVRIAGNVMEADNTNKRWNLNNSTYRGVTGTYGMLIALSSGTYIDTLKQFLNEVNKFELWLRYESDNKMYKLCTTNILDKTQWRQDGGVTTTLRINSQYLSLVAGNFPAGLSSTSTTMPTGYIVPFK